VEYIKRNSGYLFILLISSIPLVNLLTQGLPITHDGLIHVARIANFYTSLSEGNFIPRWAGNLNWGYGHPILMFLYPLPSYLTSFFHFLDISYINSFKLVFIFSYIFSGIFMYAWLKKIVSNTAAILGATLFLFAPYRFIDLYVRGAIGEHVAFTFMPLVLLALWYLFNNKNIKKIRYLYLYVVFIAFSFSFLILSHNAISLLFIPFILFYVLYLYFEKRSIKNLVLGLFSLFYGFLISFFFWFPAFIEGKYTLRDIVTENEYLSKFVEIKDLIYGPWIYGGSGEFTTQLGVIHILLVILSIIYLTKFIKTNDKQKYLLIGTLIMLFSSLFLMLSESAFIWNNLTILQKLQFPWRFLSITTFATALIGAIFIDKIKLKNKNIIISVVVFLTIISTFNYWQAKEYIVYDDSFFEKAFPSTTDTGESSPIWSVRFMEDFPKENIEILEGNAEIKELERKSNFHEYVIDVKEASRFRENTLYFPGWKVYDNFNLIENIEFQDPKNRGIITFNLNEGLHYITVNFENTKIRMFSNIITLVSILLIFIFPIIFLILPNLKIRKYRW
jgi:uncharacterized membrane protein